MSTPDPAASEPPLATLTLTPFDITRKLSAELAAGDVRLPSFPDVAQRVQRVLEDERATPAQIGKVLGANAALAARVLRIANSAVFNASGKPVTDLPTAVARLGFELVRCAAASFALRQMRLVDAGSALRPQLQELWRKGALVTGLLHNIGRLYLLVRARSLSTVVAEAGLWDQVVHDWHPRVGRAILGHWKFPQRIAMAVADQNAWDRPSSGSSPLTDVLIAATSLVRCVFYRELLDDTVTAVAPFQRLGLSTESCNRVLAAAAPHIHGLRDALAA